MLCHKLRQTPQPGPCRNFPMEFNICHLPPLAIRVGGTASNRGQCFTFKQCRAESRLEAASFQKQKLQGGSLPLLSVFWRLLGLRRVLSALFYGCENQIWTLRFQWDLPITPLRTHKGWQWSGGCWCWASTENGSQEEDALGFPGILLLPQN